MAHVLAIDAGTTGCTALLVRDDATIAARGYREFPQHFPRPGWVEHDPEDIWQATLAACREAFRTSGLQPRDVAAIGITNQRETTVVWDRATLRPVHHAIVWQDRRTAERCDELRPAIEKTVRETTGLVVDAYFSATKLQWLLNHVEGLRARADKGELAFGTVDTWVLARLTHGRHATDYSNASRTLLYDIRAREWSDELLGTFDVPRSLLPEVLPSSGRFGVTNPNAFFDVALPVSGIAGDQQAALFGQACFETGMTKNTYGTGSFVLMNVGDAPPPTPEGLLVTLAWGIGDAVAYALEGSIFVTGAAVQWLRDGLSLIARADHTEPLAKTVPDAGGIYFVPALTGLGSPYWDPYARGAIVGITRGTTKAHLARATIESMAYQTRDVIEAMATNANVRPADLRVDGGACVMDTLCQFQADQLGVVVRRPQIQETTALGAAFLAGLAEGVWSSTHDITRAWKIDKEFVPHAPDPAGYEGWKRAVERARGWAIP